MHSKAYLLGLACLGTLVGVFSGGSQTPIVGALLPLLFGLMGTAGGFFALTSGQESFSQDRIRLLGSSLIAFSFSTLVAALYMTILRTGTPIINLIPDFRDDLAQDTIDAAPDAASKLQLALLREQLSVLGITKGDQIRIVKSVRLLDSTLVSEARSSLKQLALQCTKVAGLIESAAYTLKSDDDEKKQSKVRLIAFRIAYQCENIQNLSLIRREQVAYADIADDLRTFQSFKDAIDALLDDEGSMWLMVDAAAIKDLSNFRGNTETSLRQLTGASGDPRLLRDLVKSYGDEIKSLSEALKALPKPLRGGPGFAVQNNILGGRS